MFELNMTCQKERTISDLLDLLDKMELFYLVTFSHSIRNASSLDRVRP